MEKFLIAPKIVPPLDPGFRPASLANRAFRAQASVPVQIALEQADGSIFHFNTKVLADDSAANFYYIERLVKFLLWSRGGFRILVTGPVELAELLKEHFKQSATGKFDANIMGSRIYERPFQVVHVKELPAAKANTVPLGRHLNGCRIGFDLGASDRKVAAVIDGKAVFSEETLWHPVEQKDPQWHFDQIMESLQSAAKHLPRVDAIGGSSAGVYVHNRVQVASLFRGVPEEVFQHRVKEIFLEVKNAWKNIPFEIVNDGEVTALAGSMALGENSVLGIAMGSSEAAGFVTPEGNITTWLNELAFVPVDYSPNAPADEWSGDKGCGVQYFSQQCLNRLMPAAGIPCDPKTPLPTKLKEVQQLMEKGDERAAKIYHTIGVYLGYGVAHYADFYDVKHILILGRVTTGPGGDIIIQRAREVLQTEFPELAKSINFHVPDEKEKRHGQAIAAASLPKIQSLK